MGCDTELTMGPASSQGPHVDSLSLPVDLNPGTSDPWLMLDPKVGQRGKH